MQIIFYLIPIVDFLYLLQLEEYDSTRFAKLLPRFFFRRHLQIRDTLKPTKRIQQMRIVCLLLMVAIFFISNFFIRNSILLSLIPICFILILTPLFVLLTNLLMTPWYEHLKRTKELQARKIIQQRPDLQIIAITGSYGKTTTKTALYEFLKPNFRVQYTPGNINTPTGIAQWIIDKLAANTQIVIIEMDAYKRGEIARSCAITPPDIALITNFGDQHLERFGSHENLTLGYLEVFTHAKPQAILLLDTNEYQKATQYQNINQIVKKLNIEQFNNSSVTAEQINFFNAQIIAEKVGVTPELIHFALKNIKVPDRRGDIKILDGYQVIDRSYNISESTAKQGITEAFELAQNMQKKLVVITAGIPERGSESNRVNTEYGQFMSGYANYIIVLQSIYHSAIESGIKSSTTLKATRISEALTLLKSIGTPSELLVLMQPELTDLSY